MRITANQEQQQLISNIVPTFADMDDSKSTNHLEQSENHNDESQIDQLENDISKFLRGTTSDKKGNDATNDDNNLEGSEYKQNSDYTQAKDTVSSAMVVDG